ncbi:uncharacterized protein LOC105226968 [Bactrocera dorsalis]|uniref:Uncharacterized protein LOC105226968 n=1 Tax=Bactrocera dorsalis TaxID=27457 RepID=A0A6I9V7A1_BACDO|nr:uncharacterized protein LOC105226968 [Bactrocera dorsalis]
MSVTFNFFIVAILALTATSLSASEREPLSSSDATTVEHFILGSTVDGAVPIYQFQETVTPNIDQNEIIVNIQYPKSTDDTAVSDSTDAGDQLITKVSLYLEGDAGFTSQAYATAGGIGERSITVQVVATNTETLRYIVIIDGLKA